MHEGLENGQSPLVFEFLFSLSLGGLVYQEGATPAALFFDTQGEPRSQTLCHHGGVHGYEPSGIEWRSILFQLQNS